MAHRDQRETSLASLRMLIVADGANPCEYFVWPMWNKDPFPPSQIWCNISNLLSLALQGQCLPVMPSWMCFNPTGWSLRSSVPVPPPLRPWQWLYAGTSLTNIFLFFLHSCHPLSFHPHTFQFKPRFINGHFYWSSMTDEDVGCFMLCGEWVGGRMAHCKNRWDGWIC